MSDDFEQELKQIFLEEAEQILEDAEACFLELETSASAETIDEIFRIAHTFKGSSKAAGFEEVGAFTHEFETLLTKYRSGEYEICPGAVSLFLRSLDHIKLMVDGLKADLDATFDSKALIDEIVGFTPGGGSLDPIAENQKVPISKEEVSSVLIENEIADANTLASEEELSIEDALAVAAMMDGNIVPSKPVAGVEENKSNEKLLDFEIEAVDSLLGDLTPKHQGDHSWEAEFDRAFSDQPKKTSGVATGNGDKDEEQPVEEVTTTPKAPMKPTSAKKTGTSDSVRVNISRIDGLLNSVGELVILQSVLKEYTDDIQNEGLRKIVGQLNKITKEVQDVSMKLRMVPVKPVFQKMQRIVRDTMLALDKRIHFQTVGENVEIDKTVLDMIGDPLTHLTRNAADHGIEVPADRVVSGKSEEGIIELKAAHESGRLVISITDDGKGLDPVSLQAKAIEKGVLKPGTQLPDEEIQKLIFHPGFSTKDQVTDLSGRGVGMDVVKSNIDLLGGEIQILSEKGKGTALRISLPLTLAIIDAIVVKSGENRYVVPLSHVQELVQLSDEMLKDSTDLGDVLLLRGENISVYSLRNLLGISESEYRYEDAAVIVLKFNEKSYAIVVDEVISRQQVVVKKLGDEVRYLSGYSGSTILGDGLPALILETPELIKMANSKGFTKKHINLNREQKVA